MNVTTMLLSITCLLMLYFAGRSILPGIRSITTAVKKIFTVSPPTGVVEPSFVYSANPFAYFELKLAGMHKSWTIWFNALLAGVMPMLEYAQVNLPSVQPYLPSNYYGYLMLIAVVGNIVLRFKTYNSLAEKVTPNAVPPAI